MSIPYGSTGGDRIKPCKPWPEPGAQGWACGYCGGLRPPEVWSCPGCGAPRTSEPVAMVMPRVELRLPEDLITDVPGFVRDILEEFDRVNVDLMG